MNVHVVLDTTALTAYARLDTQAVGELISEVSDSGGTVGVPAPVFAATYATVDSGARKHLERMLSDDVYTLILPMLADDLLDVGDMAGRMPLPLAHAVSQVRRYGASLATFDPKAVELDLDADDVFYLGS